MHKGHVYLSTNVDGIWSSNVIVQHPGQGDHSSQLVHHKGTINLKAWAISNHKIMSVSFSVVRASYLTMGTLVYKHRLRLTGETSWKVISLLVPVSASVTMGEYKTTPTGWVWMKIKQDRNVRNQYLCLHIHAVACAILFLWNSRIYHNIKVS